MGCQSSKVDPTGHQPSSRRVEYGNTDRGIYSEESIFSKKNMNTDDALLNKVSNANDQIDIQLADPKAFDKSFAQRRQQAIDNGAYHSAIRALKPSSLQQLADNLKSLGKGKPLIDRHWLIYMWIATNIEYDTVSYFSGKYGDQSADSVFRSKKGVCAGYGNLYQHLCKCLQMPCEIVGGFSKGFGFEDRVDAPTRTDHAWNAVDIDGHWYLVEPTWGAGHLTEEKAFERRFNPYYFLPRPDEMIYHHLPEIERWQLLRMPIKMNHFMQISHLRPIYFAYQMELVSPRYQTHLSLLPGKTYSLVLIRVPPDVHLLADVVVRKQKMEGAHFIMFDKRRQLYRCYFAAVGIGKHKITIYAKQGGSDDGSYAGALDFTLDVKQEPRPIISFPHVWKNYFDLELEIVSPANTHLISLTNGSGQTQILVRAPEDVALLGRLQNERGEEVQGASQVFFDRKERLWRCSFAPNRDGDFEAMIMAKVNTDPGSYTSAVAFQIEARRIPAVPVSFPETWPLFYELGLQLEAPRIHENVPWTDDSSYAEILMRAPETIQLSCRIEYNNREVENGSITQYDNAKHLWQMLFAPERTGVHALTVFAKEIRNRDAAANAVVKFSLNVKQLKRPMKFPLLYTQFQTKKCQILTPIDGILKRGAVVPLYCVIPNALDVTVVVDSKPLEPGGYSGSVLRRDIKVGSQDVSIFAKFDKNSNHDGLVKYSVR